MILGFSTSGPYCGAALWQDGGIIASRHEHLAKGQAERLMPMLNEVLADAGATFADLDALGVGIGPGNFTGIRISVAAARGLALGLGIPAVGISLLEALALGQDGTVLTSVSAGRGHAFFQRFGADAARGPELVALDTISDWHQKDMICIGNHEAEIAEALGLSYAPAPFYPASAVARIAALRWQDNPPRPAPLYLRPADAAPARDAPPAILP